MLSIVLCRVEYADPSRGIYRVLPNDATDSTEDRTAVVLGSQSLTLPDQKEGQVTEKINVTAAYRYGDIVLCALDPDIPGAMAIILGSMPAPNPPDKAEKDISILYPTPDINRVVHGEMAKIDASANEFKGYDQKAPDRMTSLNYVINGADSRFSVSSNDVTLDGGAAGVVIGAFGIGINRYGITYAEDFCGESNKSIIINDNTFKEEATYFSVSSLSEDSKELPVILKQTSALVSGSLTAVISDEKPVVLNAITVNGQIKQTGAGGVLIERSPYIEVYRDNYKLPVSMDSGIKTDDSTAKELYRGVGSAEIPWTKHNYADEFDYDKIEFAAVKPDSNELPEMCVVRKVGDKEYKAATIPTRFGLLPSGGFIIRDAWGSEIRMEYGDVQITAARKFNVISASDILMFGNGHCAISADSGISIGGSKNIDIASSSGSINIASGSVTRLSCSELSVMSDSDVSVKGSDIIVKSNNAYIDCGDGYFTCIANVASLVGKADAVIGTESGYVGCTPGSIVIGSSRLDVFSTVNITNGIAPVVTIDTKTKLKPSSGMGYMWVKNIVCDQNVMCNDGLITNGSVIANSVAAKEGVNYLGLLGMYKLKTRPVRNKPINASDAKPQDKRNSDKLIEKLLDISKWSVSSFRKLLFAVKGRVVMLMPRLAKMESGGASLKPCTVAAGDEKRYIYPGKSFWTESGGVIKQTPSDNFDFVDVKNEQHKGTDIKVPGVNAIIN